MDTVLVSRRSFVGGLAAGLAAVPFIGWPFRKPWDAEFVIKWHYFPAVSIRLYQGGQMEADWGGVACSFVESNCGWKRIEAAVNDCLFCARIKSPARRELLIDWIRMSGPHDRPHDGIRTVRDGGVIMFDDFYSSLDDRHYTDGKYDHYGVWRLTA